MPYWSDWYGLLTYTFSKVYGLLYVRALLDTTRVVQIALRTRADRSYTNPIGLTSRMVLTPFTVDTARSVCTEQRDSNPVASGYESRPLTD
eukprot:1438872-Ditylum_brightwellii.AAC.1